MRFLIFFLVFLSTFSCVDENVVVTRTKQEQLELDLTRIQGYINENNLTGFSSTEKGLHYKIMEAGNTTFPANGDTLSVEYIGELLDGSEFDRSNTNQPFEFILGQGQVIEGWEIGLSKIDEGGSGILIIPSGLGYASANTSSIPENSVLIFRIDLIDIR
tara:strand:- start:633 stop:1112 length:480 start_codon:yes stop_codon:yes gene_type:complete